MKKKKSVGNRHKFDAKFKSEALERLNSGHSISEVAQILDIEEDLLYKWRTEAEALLALDTQRLMLEAEQLRKQLKQVETERDILKKVMSILNPKG